MSNPKKDIYSQVLFILFIVLLGGGISFAFYENIAMLFANPAEAEYLRGARDFKDGNYEKALAGYQKSLAANAEHIASLHGRAEALLMLGRYEEALAAFSRAIELDPQSAIARANHGILLDKMGHHEEALKNYNQALKMDPELAEGPGFLTRFLRNQPDRPPNIADRAKYLLAQLALPAGQRLLVKPEEDIKQRPYTK